MTTTAVGAPAASYAGEVIAAYDSEDLHHLVDRLTPAQLNRLRLLVTQDEELSRVASDMPEATGDTEAPPPL